MKSKLGNMKNMLDGIFTAVLSDQVNNTPTTSSTDDNIISS